MLPKQLFDGPVKLHVLHKGAYMHALDFPMLTSRGLPQPSLWPEFSQHSMHLLCRTFVACCKLLTQQVIAVNAEH